MNKSDYIVFDFETGGLDPNFHEAIQIAGKAYNCRTLEPYPIEAGGEFCSLMKPLYPERLQDEALKINRKTREELLNAPDQRVVWNQFVAWVGKFNPRGTARSAPIAAGKNIRDFDMKFVEVLNKLHCPKGEKTVLFGRKKIDLEDYVFAWFENETEPSDEKMDTLRDYFGMNTDKAHDALEDCRQTGELMMKFLRLHRELQRRKVIRFKGAFANVGTAG